MCENNKAVEVLNCFLYGSLTEKALRSDSLSCTLLFIQ